MHERILYEYERVLYIIFFLKFARCKIVTSVLFNFSFDFELQLARLQHAVG